MNTEHSTLLANKKVLLLNPFFDKCKESKPGEFVDDPRGHFFLDTPLGLVYIYTYAKESLKDVEFHVIDGHAMLVENAEKGMDANWAMLLDRIVLVNAPVIGITCSFYNSSLLFHETCARIKERLPDVVIVSGGNYPSDFVEKVLEDHNVDYVVVSEGEGPFTNLLDRLFHGGDVATIAGLRYRTKEGKIHSCGIKNSDHFIDLDHIPIPDRSAFPMHLYGRGRNVLTRIYGDKPFRPLEMTISRGCPFQCAFCNAMNFWDRKLRYRDTESVLDEMEILRDEYGATDVLFNDDNFLLNKKRVIPILEGMIKRNIGLRWFANGGANVRILLDESYLDLIMASGFSLFNLAIESSSQKTLDRIKKPLNIDEVWKLVELIRKKYPSAWMTGHYIVGFPFETRAEIEYTYKFSRELKTDWVAYSHFKPFPNTELYDYCVEKGYIEVYNPGTPLNISQIDGDDWDRHWLVKSAYENNLRNNFLENTNLIHYPERCDQALRDFKYVINIMGGRHPLAYRQAAVAARMMNNMELAREMDEKERSSIVNNKEFIEWYNHFGIAVPSS